MKRIRVQLIILCFAILGAACSRSHAHEVQAENVAPRTIATSGRAVVHVPPDRAELTLGVETRYKKLSAAKKENDARIRRLLAIVGDHGIEAKDVHTSWISIHPEYTNYSSVSERRRTGYRVSNTVMVSFQDISQVEPVLTAALEAGVTNVNNVTFRHSEDRSHRDRARDMAVNAAREKAEAMAKALGQRVGRPITVSEAMPTWINPMSNANVFNDRASNGATDAGDILAPGAISIDARVSVTFEMLD